MKPHFICTILVFGAIFLPARLPVWAADPMSATNAAPRRTDANGNALRRAPTGHISNYDESKVGAYTLPDPLVLQNGKSVRAAGEMGSALARRDYGETIDDMAANFPWQFAGNFQKYSGHWTNLPVDAHTLIALNAPHPVFISGGTQDQWADPRGEFLAAVAAGPVYRLPGKKDLGTTEGPPLDTPLITGDLGFNYHTGGHTITPADWNAFLDFADRHLKPKP